MNLFRTLLPAGTDPRQSTRRAFERLVREECARQFARRAARIAPVVAASMPRRASAPGVGF